MVVSLNQGENSVKTTRKKPRCPRCQSELDARVHRSFFVKHFLFWLPLRRYACYKCNRKVYIWV